jgi:hypothetical protein
MGHPFGNDFAEIDSCGGFMGRIVARRRDIQERLARLETEARRLAWSGRYPHSTSIQRMLIAKGYRDTTSVFNLWNHAELNRICERAKSNVA